MLIRVHAQMQGQSGDVYTCTHVDDVLLLQLEKCGVCAKGVYICEFQLFWNSNTAC